MGGYDAALFDLDGVVYLGPVAVPGAVEGIAELRGRGARLGYVTNNAARTPEAVAGHLRELGIELDDDDVVTSSQAGAHALAQRFGCGAKVLVVGGEGVVAALEEEGLVPVATADDDPVAVMQGWSPDLTWNQLNEAAIAIQRGAHWLATNTDATRPTDRGIVPGNGAAVDAVRTAVAVEPEVVGKPFRPLIDEVVRRLGCRRPIFVGDRMDTDISGATEAGLDSLWVLSGAHGPVDLLAADARSRPTHIGADLSALGQPARSVELADNRARCGMMEVTVDDGRLVITEPPTDRAQSVDALWALAQLAWRARDSGHDLDPEPSLKVLEALR
ncbi:HAD-IIA family hydrolase [Microlunatus panaciterrae]|nr:HAD-IIA family hydrolase [Microlunatus panaciterrae]